MRGTVKNIQPKGFGFIIGEDNNEYFMHYTQYIGDWNMLTERVMGNKERVVVDFDPTKSERGLRAHRINEV